MKSQLALIALLLVVLVPVMADEPSLDHRVYLPVIMGSPASPNLIPDPDFEQGHWPSAYPTSYCDQPPPYPLPLSGHCKAMLGGWELDEWMSSWDIPVKGHTEALYRLRICWHTYPAGTTGDVLHLTMRESGTNRPLLMLADYGDERPADQWFCSYWIISFGEVTVAHLWLEADQNGQDPDRTWYIDYTSLTELDPDPPQECEECVTCQLQDQPPVTFCDHGPSCEALNPQCPVLPPPHFYREISRDCSCGDRTIPLNSEIWRRP